MGVIFRTTLFKVPDAENQAKLLEAYSMMKQNQVKVCLALFLLTLDGSANVWASFILAELITSSHLGRKAIHHRVRLATLAF